MTIRRKGAAPWSVDYEAGLADAPVSSHPGVEADQVKPVIDAGFIDADGSWQIDQVTDDRNFTLTNSAEAIAAGASMFIDPINMLNHDILILGLLDAGGNNINVDVMYRMNGATGGTGPYAAAFFEADGVDGGNWQSSEPGDGSGNLGNLLSDTSEDFNRQLEILQNWLP